MTSPRSPTNTKMDKSLVVNMLKFEATTKNSHLPPIARSVAEEMAHRTEAKVRAKPALKAVPDTVKLYQQMKKRGIFTVGLSADSKVEDTSFKIETKGFNLSNVPDNWTYTRAKNKDEVWVDAKKDRPKKERRCVDDGMMWPKCTRNNTMILPKLSYGVDRKKMKPLVPVELDVNGGQETEMGSARHDQEEKVTKPEADVPETLTNGEEASHEKIGTETSSANVSLISIGQDQKPPDDPDSTNRSEEPNNKQSAPAPGENSKEAVTPRPAPVFSPPVLRQVTIGVDIPEPNPDTKNKKDIRSMYPMFDSNEDKKEKQRHNWWERPQRSPTLLHKAKTTIPAQQQNRQNGATMFLAPIPNEIPASDITESTKENIKIIVPNKEYLNADELQRKKITRRNSEEYLNLPGVFEKHLEVVKTIAQSRGQAKPVSGQIDLSPQVTSLSQAPKPTATSTPPVPSVPPPSAATVALTNDGTFCKMESTVEESSVSVPGSVAPSIEPKAEPVARVEIAISGSRLRRDESANGGGGDQEKSAVLGTGLTVSVGVGGGGSVQSSNSDNHPQLAHHDSLSAPSRNSGHEDDVTGQRPSGPRRRTSSFLELPQSPIDPGEKPPLAEQDATDTKETVSPPAKDDSSGGHPTPRRRTSSFLEPPGSQCDPLERPPSKSDSVDFNPQEDAVLGEQSPRLSPRPLSRRPTPEILVSTEAEKLEVPHLKDTDTDQQTNG